MKLNEVFERVEFEKSALVNFGDDFAAEFPLDFLAPNTKRNYSSLAFGNSIVENDEGLQYIAVPLILDNNWFGQYNKWAGELLLRVASWRNIVVYDSRMENKFSNRLAILMKVCMRRNSGKNSITSQYGCGMTDLFVDEDLEVSEDLQKHLQIHKINHELYNYLLGYYFNDLQSAVYCNKYNICIGVNLTLKDSFVAPFHHNKLGLAVLDSRKVLLGCY